MNIWELLAEWSGWAAVLALAAVVIPALLVWQRAGQTVSVAEDDSLAKRFDVLSDAQERMRLALQARLDELAEENVHLRTQVTTLTELVPDLRAQNAKCLDEAAKLRWRVDELTRVVESYRGERP